MTIERNGKNFAMIAVKALLIVLAILGIYLSFNQDGFMSGTTSLAFFTIQSNITIAAIVGVFLYKQIYEMIKGVELHFANWVYIVKFVFTVAILITFLVFWALLAPQLVAIGTPEYLISLNNLTLHTLVPILAIVDFLICDAKIIKFKKFTFLYSLIMPLLYLGFAMFMAGIGFVFAVLEDGTVSNFPYFFLDYKTNTWFSIGDGKLGVFYWIIIVMVIIIALAYGVMAATKAIGKRGDISDTSDQT